MKKKHIYEQLDDITAKYYNLHTQLCTTQANADLRNKLAEAKKELSKMSADIDAAKFEVKRLHEIADNGARKIVACNDELQAAKRRNERQADIIITLTSRVAELEQIPVPTLERQSPDKQHENEDEDGYQTTERSEGNPY